jgi:hypothetical protein
VRAWDGKDGALVSNGFKVALRNLPRVRAEELRYRLRGRRREKTRSIQTHGMEGSLTDRRNEEREGIEHKEDEERLRVERERRGAELREAWRRHHPSESEDEKGWAKKPPA